MHHKKLKYRTIKSTLSSNENKIEIENSKGKARNNTILKNNIKLHANVGLLFGEKSQSACLDDFNNPLSIMNNPAT